MPSINRMKTILFFANYPLPSNLSMFTQLSIERYYEYKDSAYVSDFVYRAGTSSISILYGNG